MLPFSCPWSRINLHIYASRRGRLLDRHSHVRGVPLSVKALERLMSSKKQAHSGVPPEAWDEANSLS